METETHNDNGQVGPLADINQRADVTIVLNKVTRRFRISFGVYRADGSQEKRDCTGILSQTNEPIVFLPRFDPRFDPRFPEPLLDPRMSDPDGRMDTRGRATIGATHSINDPRLNDIQQVVVVVTGSLAPG